MKKYTILSTIYRFLCSMILIVVNWSFATDNNDNYLSLAIATCLSYIPALFIPVIYKRMIRNKNGNQITAAALFGLIIVIFPLFLFRLNIIRLLTYFVLWCVFFILETSWEMWFTELSAGAESDAIHRFSNLSMAFNQCALMIGPLIASYIMQGLNETIFYGIVIISTALLAYWVRRQHQVPVESNTKEQEHQGLETKNANRYLFIAALLLVWPVLGSFNFMIPVHVAESAQAKMVNVGLLDMALSFGMALIGFLALKIKNKKMQNVLMGLCIAAGFSLWIMFPQHLILNMAGLFGLGLGFGSLRIELRSMLAQNYSAKEVGRMVSTGNALSLPILVVCVLGSRNFIPYVWTIPFILSMVLLVLVTMLHRKLGWSK